MIKILRIMVAALAVLWIINLLGWVPDHISKGEFIGPIFGFIVGGVLVAIYTKLTKMIGRSGHTPNP